jgi:patatin-like phospholipase/acyl hydrolase
MKSKNTANTCNTIAWLLTGTVIGSLTALLIWEKKKNHDIKRQQRRRIRSSTTKRNNHHHCDCRNKEKRERLPELIILLRHGESEANADNTLWRTKPDNIINLTEKGIQQAKEAGLRIENLFQFYNNNNGNNIDININRVQIYVSPFERTLQTTWAARPFFEHRVVETLLESRIREQVGGLNY